MHSNLKEIEGYWTLRADGYSETILEQIEDGRYRHWLGIIEKHLPEGGSLRILDVGCGPGFFPIILGREGHDITAVDYTEAMLEQARANCERFGVDAEFRRMDAQHLDFEDDTFDVVIPAEDEDGLGLLLYVAVGLIAVVIVVVVVTRFV